MRAAIVAFCVILAGPHWAEAATLAGAVERLNGAATATMGSLSRPLQDGAQIFEGDRIETAENTRIRLRLAGGTLLTLGDRSVITIETASTEPDKTSVLDVVRGVFLAATSALGAIDQSRLVIETPNAVLGVRGTEVWGEQQPDHLAVLMLSGHAIDVTTPTGTVTLETPLAGTDVRGSAAPTPPTTWGEPRIRAAVASVAFENATGE